MNVERVSAKPPQISGGGTVFLTNQFFSLPGKSRSQICSLHSALSHLPLAYITYEFVPAFPAVYCMSGLSNLNSFRDRRQVAVQLVSCGVTVSHGSSGMYQQN